jgi:uncharacterized protein (DUF885 family)
MELCDRYLNELIQIDPTMNDFFLYDKYQDKRNKQPDIYSEKHYNKLHKLDLKYLKILEKKTKKTFYDNILLRDIKYNIHMETAYEIYMYMPINLNDNILIDYVTECSGNGSYTFTGRKDFLDFMDRLKTLHIITNEIIDKMKNGIKADICLPKRTTDAIIVLITDVLKTRSYDNKFKYKPIEWKQNVEQYLVKNLEKLKTFLINEYYPFTKDDKLGLVSYKDGKDAYRKIIEYYTFKGITPEVLFNFGYSELKKLNSEKRRLEKILNIKNIDDHVKKYNFSDKKQIIDKLEKIRKRLKNKIYPKYFHGQLKDSELYQIKEIPPENKRLFAYYISGDLQNKKKGSFYINTSQPKNINEYELYVLSLHEGIPGHHLQMLKQNSSELPDYLKLGDDGYSEGWAMYCENLGDYVDNYEYYFKLQYDILRSLRLILDPAIHYFGWNYEKCFQLCKKYLVNYSDSQIDKMILRYMNNPGQAITYKIGEKTMLYIRDNLLKQGYSIKDIHEIILETGPCPIEFILDLV